MILLSGSGHGCIVSTADTCRVKEVVVVTVLKHIGTLLRMGTRRVIRKIVGGRGSCRWGRLHRDLVNVIPERPKVDVVGAIGVDQVGVDRIINLG